MKVNYKKQRNRKQVATNTPGGKTLGIACLGLVAGINADTASVDLIVVNQETGEPVITGYNAGAALVLARDKFAYRINAGAWKRPKAVRQIDTRLEIDHQDGDPWVLDDQVQITCDGYVQSMRGMGSAILGPSYALGTFVI